MKNEKCIQSQMLIKYVLLYFQVLERGANTRYIYRKQSKRVEMQVLYILTLKKLIIYRVGKETITQ